MASTVSASRVVSVRFKGEIGEDLTVVFLSPIFVDRSGKVLERPAQVIENLRLGPYGFRPHFVPCSGRGFLGERGSSQDMVGRSQVFDLLTKGPHTLEFAVGWCKAVLIGRHRISGRHD